MRMHIGVAYACAYFGIKKRMLSFHHNISEIKFGEHSRSGGARSCDGIVAFCKSVHFKTEYSIPHKKIHWGNVPADEIRWRCCKAIHLQCGVDGGKRSGIDRSGSYPTI